MKRLGIVSLALAALLLSGCGEKKEHKAQAEQKPVAAATQKSATAAAQEASKEQAPATMQESAQKTKQEATQQAPAQSETAKETGEDVAKVPATEKAQESVQKVKEAAKTATEEKKSEASAAVDAAKLFTKCASCHGPKGGRKALGKSGIIAGMPKDEVLKKLKGYQAGTLNQYGMGPLMKGQVAGLSEADLQALADYISKLK